MHFFVKTRIQLFFGHSFVRHLRQHIHDSETLNFHLGLHGPPLVQYSGYSGATVHTLRNQLEDVSDFSPDILVLVIGTNDIYNNNETPESEANQIMDLVDNLLFIIGVPKVIVLQTFK